MEFIYIKLEEFEYSMFTGVFYKKNSNIVACQAMSNGYRRLRWSSHGKQHQIYAHHAAWWILTGSWPEGRRLDHINRSRGDNSFMNLRLCNGASEQALNVPTRSNTGLKNIVCYKRKNNSEYYGCFIKHRGKRYTKQSSDISRVFRWRNEKRLELFGADFSWPNDNQEALLKYGLKA